MAGVDPPRGPMIAIVSGNHFLIMRDKAGAGHGRVVADDVSCRRFWAAIYKMQRVDQAGYRMVRHTRQLAFLHPCGGSIDAEQFERTRRQPIATLLFQTGCDGLIDFGRIGNLLANHRLAILRHAGIQIDQPLDPLRQLVGNAGNAHAAKAVADERDAG